MVVREGRREQGLWRSLASLPHNQVLWRPDVVDGAGPRQITISIKVFLFDIMQANGYSLIRLPLRHRIELMRAVGVLRVGRGRA